MLIEIDEQSFQTIKMAILDKNPTWADNPQAIRAKMTEYDSDIKKDIEKWLADLDHETAYRCAISIYGQMYNILARIVGDPQVDFLSPEMLPPALHAVADPPDPILSKHVAVVMRHSTNAGSIKKALELAKEKDWRFIVYHEPSLAVQAIIEGRVCGLIGIHDRPGLYLECYLRSNLYHQPIWDKEKISALVLPSCKDFYPDDDASELLETIQLMQDGRYQNCSEDFSLATALPALSAHMYVPVHKLRIGVIDDKLEQIADIEQILAVWPNLSAMSVIYPDMLAPPYDIVLVDEDLGNNVRGTELVKKLRQEGFEQTIFASISGMGKPRWARYIFDCKSYVGKDYLIAKTFIFFVNKLLAEVEHRDNNQPQ